MKKIGLFLGVLVVLLTVSCNDMLLQKDTSGISVSFMVPGSSSRAGATNSWEVDAWLELEDGTRLQSKEMTAPANAPISLTFTEVAIGTKLLVRVDLVDSENPIKYEGSSNLIEVNAQNVNVTVTLEEVIVGAAAPSITMQPQSQTKTYQAGDAVDWPVTLTVEATSPDSGDLSYQWYESTTDSNTGGAVIIEATTNRHPVTLIPGETKYFYCVVTNTNAAVNGTKTATATTQVAALVYEMGVYGQSGVLMWKTNDDTLSMDVFTASLGNYTNAAQLDGVSFDEYSQPYCFDGNGNLYVLPATTTTVSDVLKFEIQSDFSYKQASTISVGGQVLSYLSYDNDTDTLYGLGENTPLFKLTETIDEVIGGDVASETLGLAVHNNIAYIAQVGLKEGDNGEIVVSLAQYDLNHENLVAKGQDEMTHHELPTVFKTDVSTLTGQMIYQDGALYLSIGSLGLLDNLAAYSVGAIVKINPETLDIEVSFGENGYLGLLTSVRTINNMYCYAPTEENDNAYFYGPRGFVAVMPKKLVIADSGFAMSDAGDGAKVKLSKKSRIVTVDLETEVFSSVPVENYYEPTYSTGCSFITE